MQAFRKLFCAAVPLVMALLVVGCGSGAAPKPTALPPPKPPALPTFSTGHATSVPNGRHAPATAAATVAAPPTVVLPRRLKTQSPVRVTVQPQGDDETPAPVPTPLPPPTPSRAVISIQNLAWKSRNTGGRLPSGCATLASSHVCVPRVTVDGTRIADITVLSFFVERPATAQTRREAIAEAVMQRLLYLEGIRAGIHITNAQARQLAQAELTAYLKDPATRSGAPLPEGISARQYFLSPSSIKAYRIGMVIGRERDSILAAHHGRTSTVLANWTRSVLPHHTVTVDGHAPRFSIPDAVRAAESS